jgi:hypothetical protein
VRLPTGALPAAGEPLPESSDPEITGRRSGTQASIDFTGSARDALAGKRVTVSCVVSTKTLTGATAETTTGAHAAPTAGRPLTLAIPTRYHLCAVSYGDRVARVALDDIGRAALEEGTLAAAMQRVLRSAADAAAPGYPSGQAIADSFNGDVVPLAASTDTPPDLRVGAWSDAARKLTLVGVARTGRRLFVEVDGDVVRTNAFTVPDLP